MEKPEITKFQATSQIWRKVGEHNMTALRERPLSQIVAQIQERMNEKQNAL